MAVLVDCCLLAVVVAIVVAIVVAVVVRCLDCQWLVAGWCWLLRNAFCCLLFRVTAPDGAVSWCLIVGSLLVDDSCSWRFSVHLLTVVVAAVVVVLMSAVGFDRWPLLVDCWSLLLLLMSSSCLFCQS